MVKRRSFFKGFLACVIAPLIPLPVKKRMPEWFPLLQRVSPELIMNEIVSVQPMSGPTGQIFYMDLIYKGEIVKSNSTESKPYNPEDYKDYPDFFDYKE